VKDHTFLMFLLMEELPREDRMTWIPVESTDVAAVGWEDAAGEIPTFVEEVVGDVFGSPIMVEVPLGLGAGTMGIMFHRPPGSTYIYYETPWDMFHELVTAPSKGQYVNHVIKHSGLAYDRVS
jgi:KTSC domain-containing protein